MPATYIIAASDASQKSKSIADAVCPGLADDRMINRYIAYLTGSGDVNVSGVDQVTKPNQGGTIVLTDGSYKLSAPIDFTGLSNFSLVGVGPATVIENQATSGTHAVQAINVAGTSPWATNRTADRCYLADFLVQGVSGSGDGVHIELVEFKHLDNIFAQNNGAHGIYLEASTGTGLPGANNTHINMCQCQFNTLDGMHLLNLHETYIDNCSFEENTRNGVRATNITGLNISDSNIEDHASAPGLKVINGNTTRISGCLIEDDVEIEVASANRVFLSDGSCQGLAITTLATGCELYMNEFLVTGVFDAVTRRIKAGECFFDNFGDVSAEFYANFSDCEFSLEVGDTFTCDLRSTFNGCDFAKAAGADYTFANNTDGECQMTFSGCNFFQNANLVVDGTNGTGMRLALSGVNCRTTTWNINSVDYVSVGGGSIFVGGGSMTIDDCDSSIHIGGNILHNYNVTINNTTAADGHVGNNAATGTTTVTNNGTGTYTS